MRRALRNKFVLLPTCHIWITGESVARQLIWTIGYNLGFCCLLSPSRDPAITASNSLRRHLPTVLSFLSRCPLLLRAALGSAAAAWQPRSRHQASHHSSYMLLHMIPSVVSPGCNRVVFLGLICDSDFGGWMLVGTNQTNVWEGSTEETREKGEGASRREQERNRERKKKG